MAQIYDKFGRAQERINFKFGEQDPYIVEEDSATGITYICYDDGALRAIRRITEVVAGATTTTTIEVAYGAWADRETLTYQPINQDLSI